MPAPPSEGFVLVVDDDKLILTMLSDILTEAGCAVKTAGSLDEARPLVSERPLMAFVDVNLGGEKGDTFCRQLRLDPTCWDLPVVMITSSDKSEVIRQCLVSGADDFAPKPLAKHQILGKVEAVRRGRRGGGQAPRKINKKVLLATGNLFFTSVVGKLLERSSCIVTYARDLAGMLEALKSKPPTDAAVLDLELLLPETDPQMKQLRDALSMHNVPALSVSGAEALQASRPQWAGTAPLAWASLSPYDIEEERDEIIRHLNRLLGPNAAPGDRRRKPRVPFYSTVQYRLGDDPNWQVGFGFDASESGIFVRTLASELPIKRNIEVRFRLADSGPPLTAKGLVVWNNEFGARDLATVPSGMGISFTDCAPSVWDQLRDFVRGRLRPTT